MIFSPKQLGNTKIAPEAAKADRKSCLRFGPCGIGQKALYLNSFFIDRAFYAAIPDVRRVFKRVAMSKNGFTGKGMFGSMPYLVVLLSDGTEKQCNFKFEADVDAFIDKFHELHPSIPIHSAAAEKRLAEERAKEEARYIRDLSPEASAAVNELRKASDYLNKKPDIYRELSRAAKQKRVIDNIKPGYKVFAGVIVFFATLALIYGIYAVLNGKGAAMYFLLFGGAFIFYAMSMQVLPTKRNNSKAAARELNAAIMASKEYISKYEDTFPVPYQYAHPSALKRMERVIREGRAVNIVEAYDIMKKDLMAINNTVTVSQTEYDEITAIKPIFLVLDYADDYGRA